jgi:hypothetical protein
MCFKHPVSLMKFSVCQMADGSDSMCFVEKLLCLMMVTSLCHWNAYLLQWNRRWVVSSIMLGQWGQSGDSDLLMQCRCLLSGMYPV